MIAVVVAFTVWQALVADHLDGHHVLVMAGGVSGVVLLLLFVMAREREVRRGAFGS